MTSRAGDLVTFARSELLQQIEGARERVWLASPFLTAPIAHHIAKAVERSEAEERRLLTALVGGSVRVRALDPKALLILRDAGFVIASIRNLHAKVSIVDSSWVLIGSGNLTNAGLGSTERGNAELGVVLDSIQIGEAVAIFNGWLEEADPVDDERIEAFDALPRISRQEGREAVGPVIEPPQTGALEQILAEDETTARSRSYWVKSAYHQPDDEDWWHRGWISDSPPLPKYKVGDLIVIYLPKKNSGPRLCPAVLRATTEPRDDRAWVIEHRDLGAANQYPFVTETAFVADVPVSRGVPLELIGKTGQSVRRGNCSITRAQFEMLAHAMCDRVK